MSDFMFGVMASSLLSSDCSYSPSRIPRVPPPNKRVDDIGPVIEELLAVIEIHQEAIIKLTARLDKLSPDE